jgi:hypothetical protein
MNTDNYGHTLTSTALSLKPWQRKNAANQYLESKELWRSDDELGSSSQYGTLHSKQSMCRGKSVVFLVIQHIKMLLHMLRVFYEKYDIDSSKHV